MGCTKRLDSDALSSMVDQACSELSVSPDAAKTMADIKAMASAATSEWAVASSISG